MKRICIDMKLKTEREKLIMKLKRFTALALSAVMALGMCQTSFAAEATKANGDYTGTIHFYKATDPTTLSMCDNIFVHTAEVELTDDAANLTFYVAYPLPNFASQCDGGTIYDVKMTVDGTEYLGECDIETKAEKLFDSNGSMFGINAGDTLPTEAVSVSLPRTAVDSFEDGIATSVFVNPVMYSTQNFVIKVTDLTAADNGASDVKKDEQSMEITADVEEMISEPSYTVTVPASTALGKLSTEEDTSVNYGVTVKASDLNGKLTVSAPENGELQSGENKLAFTNSFGTQEVTADTEGTVLNGALGVSAAAVKAAKAGNYTGTTTFTISYTAN